MPSGSSNKKIERVQRAGVSKSAGQPRPIGFPLAIMAILLLGSLSVFFARQWRIDAANAQPQENAGWRVAFGIWNCDKYLSGITNLDSASSAAGIDWNSSGYINVSPTAGNTGDSATFGKFMKKVGLSTADDDPLTVKLPAGLNGAPESAQLKTGTKCKALEGDDKGSTKTAEVVLFRWQPKSSDTSEPERITEDLGDVRFTEDREIFVLALVPKGTKKLDLPKSSVDTMQSMDTAPTTLAPIVDPGATTTAVDPAATTTVAPTTGVTSTVAPTTSEPN